MNALFSLAPAVNLERLLPLLILSFAIGGLSLPRLASSIALLAVGLGAGALLPRLGIDRFFLPGLFAIGGLALIGRRGWADVILPPAALIVGAGTGYWLAHLIAGPLNPILLVAVPLLATAV